MAISNQWNGKCTAREKSNYLVKRKLIYWRGNYEREGS